MPYTAETTTTITTTTTRPTTTTTITWPITTNTTAKTGMLSCLIHYKVQCDDVSLSIETFCVNLLIICTSFIY